MEYSYDDEYLIAGTNYGNLFIKKKDEKIFTSSPILISHKKKEISCKKIIFSDCSKFIAVSDSLKCISIYKLDYKYGDIN